MTQTVFTIPACVRRICSGSAVAGHVFYSSRGQYRLYTAAGEITAELCGALRYAARSAADLPVVGDWVAVEAGLIRGVAPRWSKFSRRAAGTREDEQILAANIDIVFLVCGLDADFNVRRLERYLVLARASGADPVIVLNKCDLCPDELWQRMDEARSVAAGAPVVCTSARTSDGLDALTAVLEPGSTAVLLGSSGAGKSSLVNCLRGEEAHRTQPVRESDSRGRHTTTDRELMPLTNGSFLIDTPGLREIQLWAAEETVEETFADLASVAANCHFSDCRHAGEPGCAVAAALDSGSMDRERWSSYQKLTTEVRRLDKKTLKKIHKDQRERYKFFGKKGGTA
jgi:ribosome biogenesis GTPase